MRVRLEKLDRARSEFIANASHELRTPLFSLGGFLELMADEDVDEKTRREFLETMREQVDRLAKLATDLLDLSRLDAGQIRARARAGRSRRRRAGGRRGVPRGRRALAPRGRRSSSRAIRSRAATSCACSRWPGRSPTTPSCTRRRARRITLRASADREHAYLEVEDDGPGVPAEHSPHVFDRFYRAGGGVASGSGLGLAIARELVTMMDGEVVLESQPGRTVVRVVLGAAPTSVPAPEATERVFT